MRALNWTHGLLDAGPRPKKSGKIGAKPTWGTILKGKSIGFKPKTNQRELERRAHDLKNQDAS